jgi:hypothetical protein
MGWSKSEASDSAPFVPNETGLNVSELEILLISGNTLDSVAPVDINSYVTVKTNAAMFYPNQIYNTGVWDISSIEAKVTLDYLQPRSSKVMFSGTFISSATTNSGFVSVRISDSTGQLTGTEKRYSTGKAVSATEINIGFSTVGYTTLNNTQDLFLEVSKDFAGNLILKDALISIEPLW